jgi:mono/diheme cytochrome c family protein
MTRGKWVGVGAGVLAMAIVLRAGAVTADSQDGRPAAPRKVAATSTPVAPATNYNELIQTYCGDCHNDEMKRGGLSFDKFDMAKAGENADVTERMVRKLQAGMMPPPGNERPDPPTYAALISTLESKADAAAAARPNPGSRVFPRLNRTEYRNAVRMLLDLDIDAGAWLPLDQKSANFDNIADEQTISATLLESYLNAASEISRLAVGDRAAPTADRTYTNTSYLSQHPWDHLEGAPVGSRGGMVVKHIFPVDGDYVFEVTFTGGDNSRLEDLDLSLDGQRISLVRYETGQAGAADGRGAIPMKTEPLHIARHALRRARRHSTARMKI